MRQKRLYFLAIIPPKTMERSAYDLKIFMRDKFQTKRALNSPAHITVVPPFWADKDQIKEYGKDLTILISNLVPFSVTLKDFGYFPPKVVFINVLGDPGLDQLYQSIKSYFQQIDELDIKFRESYHPHLTIGFKDLTRENFHKAKSELSTMHFSEKFRVDELFLLCHTDGKWVVETGFKLDS